MIKLSLAALMTRSVETLSVQNLDTGAIVIDEVLQFGRISGDQQIIHNVGVDTIVPGNLIIARVPRWIQCCLNVETTLPVLTTGYKSIRFRTPLLVGEPLRFDWDVRAVRKIAIGILLRQHCVVRKTSDHVVVSLDVNDLYYT